MAILIKPTPTLNPNTASTQTQTQVESFAAFLSGWRKDSLASTPMPPAAAKPEDEHERFPHRPFSTHLPPAPAPHLSSRTLRRRYTYIEATEPEVTTSLSWREHHLHFHYPNENGLLHQYQEQVTSSSYHMSPSCTRASLSRSVGAEFTLLPLPPPPFSPVGARPINT